MSRSVQIMCLVMALVVSVVVPSFADDVFYVRGDGSGSDASNGTSWASAFATIDKALESANYGVQATAYVQASTGAQAYDVSYRIYGGGNDILIDFEGGWENVDTSPVQTGTSLVKDDDGSVSEAGLEVRNVAHGSQATIGVNCFSFTNVTHGIFVGGGAYDNADIILTVENTTIHAQNHGVRVYYPKNNYSQASFGGWAQFHLTNVNIVAGLAGSGSGDGVSSAGIYMGSTIGATEGNVSTITSSGGDGINLLGRSADLNYTLSLSDVVIHDCAEDGVYAFNWYFPYNSTVTNWTRIQLALNHVTLVNNASNGIQTVTKRAGSWVKMTNSICTGNGLRGFDLGDLGDTSFSVYEGYNCFYNDDIETNGVVQALDDMSISANPGFYALGETPYPYYILGTVAGPCFRTGMDGKNMGAYLDVPPWLPLPVHSGAASITTNSAYINGSLSSTGTAETTVWVFWGDEDGESVPGDWDYSIDHGVSTQDEVFASQIIGLKPDTTYYYRFYAENIHGESWAARSSSFRTLMDTSEFICRMKISFTNYNRSEPLTNFPALVILNTNLSGFAYTQFESPTGGDLRFFDATATTSLNYEVECWATNTNSYVWVQVPIFTNDCYIWAYWGNPNATSAPAYSTNGSTWSEGYAGVWHLRDSDDNTRAENSSAESITAVNNNSTNATGVVSDGQGFDGSGDYYNLGNPSALQITGSQTIEMWLNPPNFSNRRNPFSKAYGGEFNTTLETDGRISYHYGISGNNSGTYQTFMMTDALSVNQWAHVAIIRDLTDMQMTWVKNGSLTDQAVASYGAAVAGSATAYIGNGYLTDNYRGLMDEVRISNVARTTNWLYATWLNMASNDAFFGSETVITNVTVQNLVATGVGVTNATLRGQVMSVGGAEDPDVFIFWSTNDFGIVSTGDWDNVVSLHKQAQPSAP